MKIRNIFGNEYSGAIGDKVVASRWKGIEYIRKYFIPHNPKTVFQVDQRELFDQAVVSWQPLTPEQKFRNIKVELERKSGIRFKLKDYRATFCQMAIDNGAPLQAVSKVMGHKTTQTTEQYYGRMRDEPAIAEIEKALMKPSAETVKTLE